MKYILILLSLIATASKSFSQQTLPLSTQLTISKATTYNQNNEVLNVFLIINTGGNDVGTGFLIKSGQVITCAHVVSNAQLNQITLVSPSGNKYGLINMVCDTIRDLAILTINSRLQGGFELGNDDKALIGNQVYTWGFPLGYMGPSPLFSIGYVSGVIAQHPYPKTYVKHFVVNGAFNPGNSGGPLIDSGKLIGVVQSKAAPMTPYIYSALQALHNNNSGFIYTGTDVSGKPMKYSEAQLIEQILVYYRELAQVMIGEAVTVNELKHFLTEQGIKGY